MCDLRWFLERLTKLNLKVAPNKALLGAAKIIFLGHKISSVGVGPDPGEVKAMKELTMPQDRCLELYRTKDGGSPRWRSEQDHLTPSYKKESSPSSHRITNV